MAFTPGNREKIVIISIVAIFVIAGLHFFVFSNKAQEYSRAKKEMENAKSNYNQMRNISPIKLKSYSEETEELNKEFLDILETLNLDAPKIYFNPGDPENFAQIREIRRGYVQELMRRQKESSVALTFLGEDGWDFPLELPEDIAKQRVNLWDVISKIDNVQSIINISRDSPTVLAQAESEYRDFMGRIGIDMAKLEQIKEFGSVVSQLKLMAHAELILREKPREYKITIDELYELLRIDINVGTAYMVNRQLEFLMDILDRAEENNVDEIVSVTLIEDPGPDYAYTVAEVEEVEGAEQPAGARVGPEGMPPEFSPEIPPEMMFEFGGLPPGAMEGILAPEPQEITKPLYNIVPVKLRYKATNLASSRFLYELTHCKSTYEIDDIAIRSVAEANVEVITTINVTAQVVGILVSL